MLTLKQAMLAALLGSTAVGGAVAQTIGVSWSNFQEERWKRDERAIKAELSRLGAKYISADAQGSNEKQQADIEGLIARGAQALIVLAFDADAVLPAVRRAQADGLPVLAYDRLIQDKNVFYLSFDNVEVGRMQARELLKLRPSGNYVFIKGSPTDPNANLLHSGQLEVLSAAIKGGQIKVVGEQFTEGWSPEIAQKNMDQILTKTANQVDAVVASNDATAGGVVAALKAQNKLGVPVSGQDGDLAALNRVARGEQAVSVFKDTNLLGKAAAGAAVALAKGKKPAELPGAASWSGGSKSVAMQASFLKPVPITAANLDYVMQAGWISKAQVCAGVLPAKAPAACK